MLTIIFVTLFFSSCGKENGYGPNNGSTKPQSTWASVTLNYPSVQVALSRLSKFSSDGGEGKPFVDANGNGIAELKNGTEPQFDDPNRTLSAFMRGDGLRMIPVIPYDRYGNQLTNMFGDPLFSYIAATPETVRQIVQATNSLEISVHKSTKVYSISVDPYNGYIPMIVDDNDNEFFDEEASTRYTLQ